MLPLQPSLNNLSSDEQKYLELRKNILDIPGVDHYKNLDNFVTAPAGMSCINAFHALYVYPLEQMRELPLTANLSIEAYYGLNCQVMTYTPTLQLITELFTSTTNFNDSCHNYVGDFAEFPKIYVKEYNEHFAQFSQKIPEHQKPASLALKQYQQKPNSKKIDPFDLLDFDKLTESQREFRAKIDGVKFEPVVSKTSQLVKKQLSELIPVHSGNVFIKDIDEAKIKEILDEWFIKQPEQNTITFESVANNEGDDDASARESNAVDEPKEAGKEQESFATDNATSIVEPLNLEKPEQRQTIEKTNKKNEDFIGEDVFASYNQEIGKKNGRKMNGLRKIAKTAKKK